MLPYGPEVIQGIQTCSILATLGGLGRFTYITLPPTVSCVVYVQCEVYGTLPTHTRTRTLYLDGRVGVVNSLTALLLESKN